MLDRGVMPPQPSQPVSLLSVATAVPANVIAQDEIAAPAPGVFPDLFSRYPVMIEVFRNAGIARRRAVRPIGWYLTPRNWSDRSEVFLSEGLALFEQAATTALARAGVAAKDVDIVVTVSTSGVATPSLEARAMPRLGLRPDVRRVPVFGLGCAGGVSGLSIASRLAMAQEATVLVVVLELCTLAFRLDRGSKQDAVATALFGAGAAAVVLRSGAADGLARVRGSTEHTWPGTLDVMGWTVYPVGFGVVLSRSVPTFVERRFPAVARKLLAAVDIARNRIGRYVCHPGGGRVIDAIETALSIARGTLDHERAILSEYGNMSAPTVLFALERVLRAQPAGTLALSALGPGFTASLLALDPA